MWHVCGDSRSAYSVLMGKPDGKTQLRIPWRRWYDNIKVDFEELEEGGLDWIDLAQDRDRYYKTRSFVISKPPP